MWTYTMDSEEYLTIFENGTKVWEGSYEAFIAGRDIRPPQHVRDRIHRRASVLSEHQPDCCD